MSLVILGLTRNPAKPNTGARGAPLDTRLRGYDAVAFSFTHPWGVPIFAVER